MYARRSGHSSGPPGPEKQRKTPDVKKIKSTTMTIETLLDQRRWDEARKRLVRTNSPKRVGELLFHSANCKHVPYDILETLLISKLKGKRPTYKSFSFPRQFWYGLCNYDREDRNYKKNFKHVCMAQPTASLRLFVREFVDNFGEMPKEDVRTAICHLWHCYMFGVDVYFRSEMVHRNEKEKELAIASSLEGMQSNGELLCLWEKTELLIKSTIPGGIDKPTQELPFVHAIISAHIPKVVVWMAMRMYPSQASMKDKKGKLPIHYAAALNNVNTQESFKMEFSNRKGSELSFLNKVRMVELVHGFFPKGASCVDAQGAFPLALLLGLEYRSYTTNSWTKKSMLTLAKAAPEALTTRDTTTYMRPFMVAAAIHENNTTRACNKHVEHNMLKRKLDLTYALLRLDPSSVAIGIIETRQEKYLKKKLSAAHSELDVLREENKKLQEELTLVLRKQGISSKDTDQGNSKSLRTE